MKAEQLKLSFATHTTNQRLLYANLHTIIDKLYWLALFVCQFQFVGSNLLDHNIIVHEKSC